MSRVETDDPTLQVYSDYVCPFCYLGRASLSAYRAESEDPPEVDWRPFDLRSHKRGPDGTIRDDVDDGKDEDYFAQVRQNVDRLSEQYDVEIDLDFARTVDSWNA
ncbi:MAG: DsbA family protein, partial [Halobacteriales archaeon]|nr:DsbA family protein [Halobacteriales archaeon]